MRAAMKKIKSGHTDDAPSPPTKQHRANGEESSRKRRRRKRIELCQLNLDVLFLLASYVRPLDLLNLARTCKSLRKLLMHKSSEFIWRAARQQLDGFPECPADLTEPEYANLAFFARCHSCGKHTKEILWAIRRRYCADCSNKQLYKRSLCPDIIRLHPVLPTEVFILSDKWVDKEQKDSFMEGYKEASHKIQFRVAKQDQCLAIENHARRCRNWEVMEAKLRRSELDDRKQARSNSIMERLRQHGYEPEVTHFGDSCIRRSQKAFFRTSKPLTDKEWDQMWPVWIVTMDEFRSKRLEDVVYGPRRSLLVSAHQSYVASPPPNASAVELLPDHVVLQAFPEFRDVIEAPEGAEMGENPFEHAFTQLPLLAEKWKKQLDDEFAKLVVIPSNMSHSRGRVSSKEIHSESAQASTEKLLLACAVFTRGDFMAPYPEILFLPDPSLNPDEGGREASVPIQARYRIKFLEEAPYVVHACGMDPNVATPEDMDRRNARLKCLVCEGSWVMNWRNAMRHMLFMCKRRRMTPSPLPQFQLISDEHIDAIQAAEASSFKNEPAPIFVRCLLCSPYVGGATSHVCIGRHLQWHGVSAIQQDIHYATVGMRCGRWLLDQVKMVEEEGRVAFVLRS